MNHHCHHLGPSPPARVLLPDPWKSARQHSAEVSWSGSLAWLCMGEAHDARVGIWGVEERCAGRAGKTGSQAARQPGSRAARQPGSRAARQPGSQAARQPGSQAARQPGSQAARQPGSQAARQPGSQVDRPASMPVFERRSPPASLSPVSTCFQGRSTEAASSEQQRES